MTMRRRLIPAHAGKTLAHQVQVLKAQAHPRSRGENKTPQPPGPRWWGSSPLTRGKLLQAEGHTLIAGLIPAHAGKTSTCGRRSTSWTAHPRSRGENICSGVNLSFLEGSSPLTRGKPLVKGRAVEEARLIPAHAGKTRVVQVSAALLEAHPRSRGENVASLGRVGESPGSSPLTRGKPGDLGHHQRRGGLIPAHAGKTQSKRRLYS